MAEEFNNGPNQVIPSENVYTTEPDGCVKLRIPKSGMAIETIPPISVPGLLRRTVETYPNHTALAYKVNGEWKKISYSEYEQKIRTCAKAFLSLGLERFHSVCILGFNSPEWFISDLAAIFAGGIAVGIYTTNSAEACFYCAENSRANIIVVQDDKQLQKIQSIRHRLPKLKAVIQYEGEPTSPDVLSWSKLMEIGEQQSDDQLEQALKKIAINQCCTIVYTSGTVGNPKGVMLHHDNLTWDATAIVERVNVLHGCEHLISYLPLSHVAAQIIDIYIATNCGAAVYFADKDALKGSLVKTMQEVQPTTFIGVPRVWEKIHEKMIQIGAQSGGLKKAIASWAKSHGLQHHLNKMNGIDTNGWGYYLASSLVFKFIKQALGLSRCKLCISAAAPISPDIKKYFMSIDIPLLEAFGMSEVSGAHTVCTYESFNLETIGKPLPGAKVKLHEPDEQNQGELCLKGRNIFMGYLGSEEKTAEAIDQDGWLHSGDVGMVDEKGFVYITGRLKELLITAGGENIPPVAIEQAVKLQLPHISYAFLVGDRRKFLSVLLTLRTEVDPETAAPQDQLLATVQEWLKDLGCPATTVTEVLKNGPDQRVLDAIQEGINRVNDTATSNAQKIQKFAILPIDFSVATGELGPTMKMKRRVVLEKYSDLIEKLYA